MTSGTGSSKRKSSPLLEKKRRTKDRSKKRSKIGRAKSKKVSRREIPDTYLDDESLSSGPSVPCSGTDNDRRRSRSRTRKDKSKSRKKSRRSPVSSESSEDTIRDRRSKRSKKSKGTDAKRKGFKRKRKREPSISSVSCSTCRSSDDSEREDEKRAKRRTKSRRELKDDRSLRGHRSRSGSSCRPDGGDGSYVSEKQGEDENNPKRLRSIIIFAKDSEEADADVLDRDMQKEEIIYDHDDYPSARSNDSNEADEMVGSKVSVSELSDINVQSVNASGLEEQETNVSSAGNDGSSAIDLETILRQKALENLRKFKGGVRANANKLVSTKNSYDGEVKQSPGLNADGEGLKRSASQSVQTLPKDSDKVDADDERLESDEVLKDEHLRADKLAKQILPTTQDSSVETSENLPLPTEDAKGMINYDVIQESSVPEENKQTVERAQPCCDTKMVTDVDHTTSGVSKSSNVRGNGDEEGSQFEQKTMSVMRGGEMVQVSYKVYIPKRAPALARRKLRR